jgi:hypothetical protein
MKEMEPTASRRDAQASLGYSSRMLRRFLLLALVLFVAAPLVVHAKKAPGTKPAPVTPSPKPNAPSAHAPKDALLTAADEIARQVSALRNLTALKPLQKGVLSRDEIGAKLRERIGKEYTPEEVRSEARVLKRLGLLPADADYEKMILDLLMEQVAGFYDPFTAKLYIADWLPLEMQRPALAHEIEHALQDQHFDLKRFAEPIKDDGDRQLAHSALVEGDGTAVMLEFQAQSMGLPVDQLPDLVAQIGKQMLQGGMGSTPLFDKAPAFLKETLIFPYLGGLGFIESLRKTSPWSKVDEVFKSPPESTEQILHPEKFPKEHPLKVTAAPLASLGARKELRRDVLGELEWRIWFETKLAEADAEKAAAGWGGDRLVAYADPAGPADAPPVVVDLSAWDTETDAKEAEAAARKVLAKLTGKEVDNAPGLFHGAAGDESFVQRKGDQVILIIGAPEKSSAQVAAEMWKSWKVSK